MLASVSNDKRVAALILGWCFGNFMEGIAGFGTAVAIPAAMMVGLGFDPIASAVICLIGNAASPHSVLSVHRQSVLTTQQVLRLWELI